MDGPNVVMEGGTVLLVAKNASDAQVAFYGPA